MAVGVLSVTLLSACGFLRGCEDGRRPITYVDIEDKTKDDANAPAKLDRKKLESSIAAAMATWPDFAFRGARSNEESWQVDVVVEHLRERTAIPEGDEDAASLEGKKRRLVEISMRRFALQRGGEDDRVTVTRAENVAPSVSFDEIAHRAILEGARLIEESRAMRTAAPADLITKMSDEDAAVRHTAVRIANDRKLAEALPRLTEIVRDEAEKEEVVLAAIGALVAIGDPSAAPALIDAGRRRAPVYVAQILYALGALGGRDAQGYLFTVQSGHPNPALRNVAKEALEELERRAQRTGTKDGGSEPN